MCTDGLLLGFDVVGVPRQRVLPQTRPVSNWCLAPALGLVRVSQLRTACSLADTTCSAVQRQLLCVMHSRSHLCALNMSILSGLRARDLELPALLRWLHTAGARLRLEGAHRSHSQHARGLKPLAPPLSARPIRTGICASVHSRRGDHDAPISICAGVARDLMLMYMHVCTVSPMYTPTSGSAIAYQDIYPWAPHHTRSRCRSELVPHSNAIV